MKKRVSAIVVALLICSLGASSAIAAPLGRARRAGGTGCPACCAQENGSRRQGQGRKNRLHQNAGHGPNYVDSNGDGICDNQNCPQNNQGTKGGQNR